MVSGTVAVCYYAWHWRRVSKTIPRPVYEITHWTDNLRLCYPYVCHAMYALRSAMGWDLLDYLFTRPVYLPPLASGLPCRTRELHHAWPEMRLPIAYRTEPQNFTNEYIYRYPQPIQNIYQLVKANVVDKLSTSPHVTSATGRNGARYYLPAVARLLGFEPLAISGKAEEGMQHQSLAYSYRDCDRTTSLAVANSSTAFILIDTDYYVDMPALLCYGRPIFMYTFVPQQLSGSTSDSSYYIDLDNNVHFRATGGTFWQHPLWDYNHESLTSPTIRGLVVTYQVIQIPLNDMRRIIVLYPRNVTTDDLKLDRVSLKLMSFRHGSYLTFLTHGERPLLTISRGKQHSITLPLTVFWELQGRFETWKKADIIYNVACMEQNLKVLLRDLGYTDEQIKLVTSAASILHAYLRENADTAPYDLQHYTDMLHYRVDNGDAWSSIPRYNQVAVSQPMVAAPNLAPTKDMDADKAMVTGRVTSVANNTQPPPIFLQYASEFIQNLMPQPCNADPWDMEFVMRNQNGPQQRARRKKWITMLDPKPRAEVSSFVKSESYAGPKWPRAITQTSVMNMLELSTFTYAFKSGVLKHQTWYGPCLDPEHTTQRLTTLAHSSLALVEKDYSKFDGTISKWLRNNIELAALLRYFHPDYHQTITTNFKTELNAVATSKNGVTYALNGSRLSGSALTTDGNTLINAFVSYCAYRQVFNPNEAYQSLGLYYGDDGIDRSIAGVDFKKPAEILGLEVKLQEVLIDNEINYLGRVFPNIWASTTSYADLERALGKLHIVNQTSIPKDEAWANKAQGYLVTDPNTPILSDYCRRILRDKQSNQDTMTKEEISKVNNPWPQQDTILIKQSIQQRFGNLDFNVVSQLIDQWDLITEPPYVLPNHADLPPKNSKMAVLGHYVDMTSPLIIKQDHICHEIEMEEIKTPADGNCFFHAVNLLRANKDLPPSQTRLALRNVLQQIRTSNNYPWDVIESELPDQEWVGLEVIALWAHWRQIRVCVHNRDKAALCGECGDIIHIAYNSNHYTALKKKEQTMRTLNTLPQDLADHLKQLASCRHKASKDFSPAQMREPNKVYTRLNQNFGALSECDPHDTLEGYNPSWKATTQLPTLHGIDYKSLEQPHLITAVLEHLNLPLGWAPYIIAMVLQRPFYGCRQESMTDWDRELQMFAHPFTVAMNLASLLHLDLTIRFALNRTRQACRFAVPQPDFTLILALINGKWHVATSQGTLQKIVHNVNQPTSKQTQAPKPAGKSTKHSATTKSAIKSKPKQEKKAPKNYQQPRNNNKQRPGPNRSPTNTTNNRGRDANLLQASASNVINRNQTQKPSKSLRKVAAKKVIAEDKLCSISNDHRVSSDSVVANDSTKHAGPEPAALDELIATHEESSSQDEQCGNELASAN
uniref:RNA-directed RNA polymerase n=1 Tax=Sylvilagus tetnovirus TaxID=3162627 RepID=A0AAU7NID1_9VIRU